MRIRLLNEAQIKKGARVIVRADFDVAIRKGKILDYFRPEKVLPTVRHILRQGGNVRLIAHLGRPGGRRAAALSLKPFVSFLSSKLNKKVILVRDFGERSFRRFNNSRDILLFENIRFYPEEEKNSRSFASKISLWGDIYVNEAFADSHRQHASIEKLAKILPSFAGFNLEKELYYLDTLLRNPRRPYIAVIGGIKIETKLLLVNKFLAKADRVLVGSGFVGKISPSIKKLYVPEDYIVSGGKKVDLGPWARRYFQEAAKGAGTVIWNGPLGRTPYFPLGTRVFARALVGLPAVKIIGGGDTIAALQKFGIPLKSFDHVSTGGGAMLEMLAGKKLPGIEALKR